jgi:nucleoside-diphosphate-sugar epimerase
LAAARDADLWINAAAAIDLAPASALPIYRGNALLSDDIARYVGTLGTGARLAYLSSISVYGRGQSIAAEVEPAPDTDYGLSKLVGERLSVARLGFDRCAIIRLAGVWGREERPKLFVNRCLETARLGRPLRIRGDGHSRRNYLWVGDVAGALLAALQCMDQAPRLLSGPTVHSVREMAEAIAARYGVGLEIEEASGDDQESDVIVPCSPGFETTPFTAALELECGKALP